MNDGMMEIWKMCETMERLGLVVDEVILAMALHSYWRNK
jgi:hypothetical protein